MGLFTKISSDTFDELQLDAGVLLTTFDPTSPATPADADIICATTGGINIVCAPTYSDFGEDVDNVPNNMMEFKHLDGWDCHIGFTSIKFSSASMELGIGAYSESSITNGKKIVPNRHLDESDFQDLWWVGDKADGGAVAVKIMNGLSTDGLSIQTTKNGKGTISMTITGHVSIDAQDTMPMEFYILDGPTLGSITVTSTAGSAVGDSNIAVSSYTPGSGEHYVYKTAASTAPTVEYGQKLNGWTSITPPANITPASGDTKITVASVDTNNRAVASGSTTLTKKQ